jgi:DNA-binding NtrC family response regulator
MPEPKRHRALLAIEDKRARSALRGYFRSRGDVTELTAEAADLVAAAREVRPCAIVLETQTDHGLIEQLRYELPETPVVVLVSAEVQPRNGTGEAPGCLVLKLPLTYPEMESSLDEVFQSLRCACLPAALSGEAATLASLDLPLFQGVYSPRMNEVREIIGKVATTNAAVLIRGESGVGKELAARMIYQLSERRTRPFIKVNCAAIPNDLLESELFGYEAGAFTGAHRAKPGKFELANGGTIFLDEIAEMHPSLQAKLLHVLQDGEFARLGAKQDTSVDVRIICATNRHLEARVAEGLFREDLLYRINVVTVDVPPLRERSGEIPILVQSFLERYSSLYAREAVPLDARTMAALAAYHWPGNIRELENFCKRYVILGDAQAIMQEWRLPGTDGGGERRRQSRRRSVESAPEGDAPGLCPAQRSLLEIGREAARQAESMAIQNMLAATHWNRREAAKRLQVSYKALLNKIKRMELDARH